VSATGATIYVAPRSSIAGPDRPGHLSARAAVAVRGASFAALALYAVIRWATLLGPAPTGRLVGLVGLSVALVVLGPALRRLGPPPAIVAAVLLCLLALPVAGLPWADLWHLRVAVSLREVGRGLSALPGSYVPYTGGGHAVRLVIVLGAAVLLLDGALVLAFAPNEIGDGRRGAAALPLIALAIVPSTLLRPGLPYLQGLILFALLALFLWGERIRLQGLAAALSLVILAAMGGALLAPRLDRHHALVNYRSWAGTTIVRGHLDSFDWNQSYGPLHWPHSGHPVMTVSAARPDYWKAQDLDVFNGSAWVAAQLYAAPLPPASAASQARWTQAIHVDVTGMRSPTVIAAGTAQAPVAFPGATLPGDSPGTWVAEPPLGPGASYTVTTYTPHPTAEELAGDHGHYPAAALAPYTTVTLPVVPAGRSAAVRFPLFPARRPPAITGVRAGNATAQLRGSVYAPAYALARRLRTRTASAYAFAVAVKRYLSSGYTYNENPPLRRYPLLAFLFRDKIGYCQQFSGTMALLLRMGGVPARVSSGFTPGEKGTGGQWVVTDIDAHAWVEAWFPGYGWVRFDPTPKSAPARGGSSSLGIIKPTSRGGPATASPVRRVSGSPAAPAHPGRDRPAGGTSVWLLVPAAVVAAGVLFLLMVWLLAPEPRPEERLLELERALQRTGRPLGPDVTLAALERRFHDSPPAAAYIRGLRLARYGGASVASDPGGRRALREQLGQGLGVPGRLRALWALPPGRGSKGRRRAT
jgi:transglutaminase-like putative cysteine protease